MSTNKESPEELKKLANNLKDDVVYKPIRSPIKRLNYFWKDKEGNELSFKEFMARWKEGIEGITPLQQVKQQLNSTYIIMIGICAGFAISLSSFDNLWWLSIILFGAFINSLSQAVGLYQKKRALQNLEASQTILLEEIMGEKK
jgi:hypothetical protein